MVVEVNLTELEEFDLTASQYVFLKLTEYEKELETFKNRGCITQHEVDDLILREFISYDEGKYKPSETVKKHFGIKDPNFFDEFYDLYPVSANRPDGTKDYLRMNVNKCRKKYNTLVGKSLKNHRHMMECLQFEIQHRTRTNKMGFMKRMWTWLTSEEWQLSEEMMKDVGITRIQSNYGTSIE